MQPETFLDPKQIFDQVEVMPATQGADFGCGPGFFSLELARRAGRTGHVWSLDILPQALESVLGSAAGEGIHTIDVRRVNLERIGGSKLDDSSLDFVVIKDMLFQNKDHAVILQEAYRVLKPNGHLLVIEWNSGESAIGPDRSLRIPAEALRSLLESCGFSIEKSIAAGDFHYGFLASKVSK